MEDWAEKKHLLQRHSLAAQATGVLREAIRAGQWREELPGS